MLRPAAYGGCKDASAAWAAAVLRVGAEPAVGDGPEGRESLQDLQELWEERTALMVYDGKLPHAEAARLAWAGGEEIQTALWPRPLGSAPQRRPAACSGQRVVCTPKISYVWLVAVA